METQPCEMLPPKSQVKSTFRLGAELYSVQANEGNASLSEQIVSLKEQSMSILKDFITKHNVPHEVPDDLVEPSSEDEDEFPEKPQEKSKKTKLK
ncbi:hypothetical protein L6164_034769 [Bauhinia variegata]|uniref:Uncharacterized protein n=1 Tax=Bauhinia variegata TaxID=167791 RepID=A0ACB9KW68_BAUVA|nr:hypothetical protein L6164_034769 [Bauhinia variegata]